MDTQFDNVSVSLADVQVSNFIGSALSQMDVQVGTTVASNLTTYAGA